MDNIRLEKYAQLLVRVGANVQPGQILVVQVDSYSIDLARALTKAAFEVGAKDVIVFLDDPIIKRLRGQYGESATLREVAQWKKDALDVYFQNGAAQIGIFGTYPTLMEQLPLENVLAIAAADNELRNVVRKYIHDGSLQWCGTAWANEDWARKVYPELEPEAALAQLEDDLCTMNRVSYDNDPIAEWKKHCAALKLISDELNRYNFDSLHLTTEIGTDITLKLVEGHRWGSAGSGESGKTPVAFIANMPTEEIYTVPDWHYTSGVAVASFPLMLNGKLVKDFSITFKEGLAVDCQASENEEVLRQALFENEQTRALGEVALVSKYSPIRLLQRVYYNGLIDENAASHLAFGSSFPTNVAGGLNLNNEELLELGVNVANCHTDFMIGSDKMKVVGTTKSGEEVVIMENGEFVISQVTCQL